MQNTAGSEREMVGRGGVVCWRRDRNLGKFEKRRCFNFKACVRAVLALHFSWKFRLYHRLTVCSLC